MIKKALTKIHEFLKNNYLKMILFLCIFSIPATLITILDTEMKYKNFSSKISSENLTCYQISTLVDQGNYENAKSSLTEFRSRAGAAYYAMDIDHQPLSYLYTNSNIHPESCISINAHNFSVISFASFNVYKSEDSSNRVFDVVGSTNIHVMFEKSYTDKNKILIYISDVFANELLEELHFDKFEDLLGVEINQQRIPGNPFSSVVISNIYLDDQKEVAEIKSLIGNFVITPRLFYLGSITENIRSAVLLNKKEFTNIKLFKTFMSFYEEEQTFTVQTDSNTESNAKYSILFDNYMNNYQKYNIVHYVSIGLSATILFSILAVLVFKKKFKVFFKEINFLTMLIPLSTIFLVHVLCLLFWDFILISSVGLILSLFYCLGFVYYFTNF